MRLVSTKVPGNSLRSLGNGMQRGRRTRCTVRGLTFLAGSLIAAIGKDVKYLINLKQWATSRIFKNFS